MSDQPNRQQRRAMARQLRKRASDNAGHEGSSRPARPGPSRSDELLAAKLAIVEAFDGHATLRNGIRRLADARGEWAGIPMPLQDQRLVIEPTYPHAAGLMSIGVEDAPAASGGERLRNAFHSSRKRRDVLVFDDPATGRVDWCTSGAVNNLNQQLQTLGCADAWGIEQEHRAVQLLGTLVRHRQMKQYLLTGMFLETSNRSRVTYLFRKLRPTLAISMRGLRPRVLAALCMHPIGYYADSWAGAMCPTDDVVAHLMLMRGDEHMFWRRCNQHPAWRAEAGL